MTTRRILREDLAWKSYKIQMVQDLKPTDHSHRRRFTQFIQEQHIGFSKKNIFQTKPSFFCQDTSISRIAAFGLLKIQKRLLNEAIAWSTCQYMVRDEVWRRNWVVFFEDLARNAVTVTGLQYREMLTTQFWPIIDDMDITDTWPTKL